MLRSLVSNLVQSAILSFWFGSKISIAERHRHLAMTNRLGTCRQGLLSTCGQHFSIISNMLRLPANTFRPLFKPILLRSKLRKAFTSNSRFFSSGLVQCLHQEPSKLRIFLPRGSRTIMADRPIVQETNSFSWRKLAMTAVSSVQHFAGFNCGLTICRLG